MADKEIKCAEAGCEEVRIFTQGEQEFFAKKGFKQPKYCKTHSEQRKQAVNNRRNSPFAPILKDIKEHGGRPVGRAYDDKDFN